MDSIEQQVAQLESLLQHPGWKLLAKHARAQVRWVEDQQQRTLNERPEPKFSGDFLRGFWRGLHFHDSKIAQTIQNFKNAKAEEAAEQNGQTVGSGSPYED